MILSLSSLIAWLTQYRYAVMFPVVVFEGPIITVLGGFLAAHDILNVYIVYVIAVVGDLAGDMLYYSIGRWGRDNRWIRRWVKLVGITDKRIEKLENHFANHSGKTLIFGKISHGIGSVILFASGAAKMPIGEFLWYNLIGTLPKTLIFLLIGYYFGEAYKRISQYIDYTALTTFLIGVALVVGYILIARYLRKKS